MKTQERIIWQIVVMVVVGLCPVVFAGIDSPIAHWTFDEGSGTTAYDSAGSNNGTLINGPARTAGKFGNALSFDGTNDYVEISGDNDVALEFTKNDSFTISCWAQTSSNSNTSWLVCKMRSAPQHGVFGYQLEYYSPTSAFAFTVESSFVYVKDIFTANNSVIPGNWYHVAAVYDNTQMTIYLDGLLKNTGTFTANTGTTFPDKNMTIGARSYDSTVTNYFDGLIDDVRIYDYALSAGEVSQLYQIPEPATICLFSLALSGILIRRGEN